MLAVAVIPRSNRDVGLPASRGMCIETGSLGTKIGHMAHLQVGRMDLGICLLNRTTGVRFPHLQRQTWKFGRAGQCI